MTTIAKLAGTFLLASGLSIGMIATVPNRAAAQGQPEMHEALEHLAHAKAALEHASSHHGGHRDAAIHHVDQAIEEVKAGIEWARTHPEHH